MSRRSVQYSSLTSLLDVLFLLLFAALVQRAGAAEEAAYAETMPIPADAGPADAGSSGDGGTDATPAERLALDRGLEALEERLRSGLSVVVSVRDGRIHSIQARTAEEVRTRTVDLPLTLPSPDPDVALVYAGDDEPSFQVCAIVAAQLEQELIGAFVVIELDADLERLPVALAEGLRTDERRCASAGASAVILTPTAPQE